MFLPTDITLKPGDSGEFVAEMQRRLAARDLLPDGGVSGLYDGMTEQAVNVLQAMSGLRQTGIADPATLRALNGVLPAEDERSQQEEEERLTEEEQERYHYQQMTDAEGGDDSYEADEEKEAEQEKENLLTQAHVAEKRVELQAHRHQEKHPHEQEVEMAMEEERAVSRGKEELQISQHGVEAKTMMDNLNEKSITAQDIKPEDVEKGREKTAEGAEKTPELKIDQQGMEARTPQQALNETPVVNAQEKAAAGVGAQATENALLAEAAEPGLPDASKKQGVAPAAPAQDPKLAATERQMDGASVQQSRAEGRALDARGVQQGADVPEAQLGELVPAQTPHLGRQQQQGMGM